MIKYLVSANTNIGNTKKINQDAALIMEGESDDGKKILLACVCDGMGGLSMGEVASGVMIQRTKEWFTNDFPPILFRQETLDFMAIQNSLNHLVDNVNNELSLIADIDDSCGTTCVLLLTDGEEYMTMNVGDSRIYKINGNIEQLTKDQTFVQREIDLGHITEKEAATHPRRSVLLQCIGASEEVIPEYTIGELKENDGFMLCSDGFRHKITLKEFLELIDFNKLDNEEEMHEAGEKCIHLNMQRKERDNITVILVHPIHDEVE